MANLPYPPISNPTQMAMSALDMAAMTQTINQFVMGPIASLGPAFTTTGTSANTFMTASVNGGILLAGHVLRLKAAGTSAAANTTTITFNFGAFVATCILVTAGAEGWWCEIDVVIAGLAVESSVSYGVHNVTPVQAVAATNGSVSTAAAVAMTIQATASASTSTVVMATLELVR